MAETCIVCLGDLAHQADGDALDAAPSLEDDSLEAGADTEKRSALARRLSPPKDPIPSDEELVAHLLPCKHNLHNECLKPWVERANSCPICRASFNMVELCAKIGGPVLSSYTVQDKQQVADIDPSMIIEEDDLFGYDDGSYDVCMVCAEFGDSTQLMYCHCCDLLCHVFCAGLDAMPSRGPWYCQTCMEDPSLLAEAAERSTPRNPAAFIRGRPRRRGRRARAAPDEWVGVWQSVWDRLHFDLDFPFDDENQSQTDRSEIQRREDRAWQRRLEVARRNGAGNRFRAARAANTVLRREPPKTPVDPESQEELRAWNAFDKAREQLEPAPSSSSSRHRKRKSVTASPVEPESREPERKLKRPRVRMPIETGESSTTRAHQNMTPGHGTRDNGDIAGAGFLQSLLKEVEVDKVSADQEIVAPQPRRVIIERACSPQNSSPGLSPVYPSPMTPPPPLTLNPAASPQQSPAEQSPGYSPATDFSPYSPADDEARPGRRRHSHRSRGQLDSPPRSKDSSPSRSSLSYSTKAEIQRMVTVALKPRYVKKEINKDEYTDINRDISRLMYDRVAEAGIAALTFQSAREKWQTMAGEEVDNVITALRGQPTNQATPEDSASSSS